MAVTPKEPEPVSEYVRALIEQWEQSGKQLKDFAEKAGLGKSMPSQIKARTSNVTNYSGAKIAAIWGMELPRVRQPGVRLVEGEAAR